MLERATPGSSAWFLFAVCACLPPSLSACSRSAEKADHNVHTTAPRRLELLEVGDEAPHFKTKAHDGSSVELAALRGKVVILYFYPKDGTPGCTMEAEAFASHHDSIEGAGAIVLGVSTDDSDSHRKFAADHNLPFLLIPDTDRTLAEAYGVGSMLGMTARVTYIIDTKGKIATVYPNVHPKDHASEVVQAIAQLTK